MTEQMGEGVGESVAAPTAHDAVAAAFSTPPSETPATPWGPTGPQRLETGPAGTSAAVTAPASEAPTTIAPALVRALAAGPGHTVVQDSTGGTVSGPASAATVTVPSASAAAEPRATATATAAATATATATAEPTPTTPAPAWSRKPDTADTPWAQKRGPARPRATARLRKTIEGLPDWEPLPPGEIFVQRGRRDG